MVSGSGEIGKDSAVARELHRDIGWKAGQGGNSLLLKLEYAAKSYAIKLNVFNLFNGKYDEGRYTGHVLFNRYQGAANHFGDHVDNAVRTSAVTGAWVRTDLKPCA